MMSCLFFETQAEEAARYYVSIFPNSSVDTINHFSSAGKEMHQQTPGTVMSVSFTLNQQKWLALNSRPKSVAMTEAVSFQVICDTQEDVDYYWGKLTEGISEEDRKRQMCGWLRDRFGVSWQIVPRIVMKNMSSGDGEKMEKTMMAVMKSGKIVVGDVEEAVGTA